MATSEVIEPAHMLLQDGVPYSPDFSDIYHSPDGPQGVRRVFIEPTGLHEGNAAGEPRWVGELGFGTGLNFAVLVDQCKKQHQQLHFVSCEAAPLHPDDFAQVATQRTSELSIYQELNSVYPPLIRGWHRRYLAGGLVTLSLYWGDAQAALAELVRRQSRQFHAWFLDGFAPNRNPQMWTPALLAQLGQLSSTGTSVATSTVSGHVRRDLQAAGFDMRRVHDRPHKRESLAGTFRGPQKTGRRLPSHVAVVGGGLAGASVACQLARRGVRVRLFEKASEPASGASQIPVSMLHPRLLANGSSEAQLRCHAYLYSAAFVAGLQPSLHISSGALQLPSKNADQQRLEAIAQRYHPTGSWLAYLEQTAAEKRSDWKLNSGALWFPNSHPVDMADLCGRLLNHDNIEVRCDQPISLLSELGDIPVVLACAEACTKFAATAHLELAAVHGQIDLVRLPQQPSTALVGNGYIVPWQGNVVALGSTYEHSPWSAEHATDANLGQLPQSLRNHARWLSRSRGTRCVTSDRLPIAGQVFNQHQQTIPNLYVATGMGSMGNVFCHYAGEILASRICGEFPPATSELEAALSPLRFRLRQARRGYRFDSQP